MAPRSDDLVGGVVLAAGTSTRFESGNKLVTPVDGTPIVRLAANTACESVLDDVVAVVGHERDAVEDAFAGLPIAIRYNPDYEEGQSTSVRCGITYARAAGWDAAVFLLGDMPFVRPETVTQLVTAYREGTGTIVAPRFEGTRGNPVLFDEHHFDALADVTGDTGGRDLIESHDGTRFVETDDPGTVRDIDSETDLRKYIR